ncbi:MAG TPA: M1 family metallopeptidase, partial [Thermoanaerobaculia bacterium]
MRSLPFLLRWSLLPVALAALAILASPDTGASTLGTARDDGRRPFATADDPPHYLPERLYHLEHVKLDLRFDLVAGTVAGTATNTLTPLLPGVDHLVFHAAELDVKKVRVGGQEAAFALDPTAQTLTVRLAAAAGPTDKLEVAIEYAAKPRSGLYFVGPDAGYPTKPREMFSQGETELNRYWFPSWDEPDDRTTTETLATVQKPYQAISNGRLVEVLDRPDGWRTYHWSMEQPHSTYLTSVAAGEFTRIADEWHGIPIEYYVPVALAGEARRSFGDTPAMMDFFSNLTGRPYPYAKYAQVAVHDFMFGGMENISATTQTARTLHDERAELDNPSEELVSHELAHQWFGDLVTCRDWGEGWLNEGFATYSEYIW